MSWIETAVLYWRELSIVILPTAAWIAGTKSRDTKNKTDEVALASQVVDIYKKMIDDVRSGGFNVGAAQ